MKFQPSLMLMLLIICLTVTSWAQQPTPVQADKPNPNEVIKEAIFKNIHIKEAMKNIGRTLKINVVFDESVRVQGNLDLELHDVTLEAALKIMMIQAKMRASWIEDNTILVYADNAQLRQRFQEFKTWEPKSNASR